MCRCVRLTVAIVVLLLVGSVLVCRFICCWVYEFVWFGLVLGLRVVWLFAVFDCDCGWGVVGGCVCLLCIWVCCGLS